MLTILEGIAYADSESILQTVSIRYWRDEVEGIVLSSASTSANIACVDN